MGGVTDALPQTNIAAMALSHARVEEEFAVLMRAGLAGDAQAYRQLLSLLTPRLRAMAKRGLERSRAGNGDAEDIVQEILLAVHLKRHTWMTDQPFLPWLNAIARYKLIDVLRRRGRRSEVPIDGLIDILPDTDTPPESSAGELERLVGALAGREHQVVSSISLGGEDIRQTARKLGLSEGAVRVALHRGLKRLAKLHVSLSAS